MKSRDTQFGFTLVEMLVYIALLGLILTVLINITLSFSKSYEQIGALRAADQSALTAMERMIRDIHSAAAIDTGLSVFGTSPGVLVLTNDTITTRFYVVDGEVRVDVGGAYLGPLSLSSAEVTNLVFTHLTTEETQAIKIEMTVEGRKGGVVKTKTYRTTATLKES